MTIKFLSALFFVAALLLNCAPAEAKGKAKQEATFVEKPAEVYNDAADLKRIEEYLNGLRTLQANFTQTSDNGDYRHGTLSIQRPGKMHVDYDAPSKDFVVADGSFVNMWDGALESQTSVPLSASLGDLILRDEIKLSGDIAVDKIERAPAKIEVTVFAAKDPAAGKLTLVFEDRPLKLRQWKVVDLQNFTTTVSLENAKEGVTLSPGLFHFTPPNFGTNKRK